MENLIILPAISWTWQYNSGLEFLSTIELDRSVKAEIVSKIQKYFTEELQHKIGGFEAEFLLDFFSIHKKVAISVPSNRAKCGGGVPPTSSEFWPL